MSRGQHERGVELYPSRSASNPAPSAGLQIPHMEVDRSPEYSQGETVQIGIDHVVSPNRAQEPPSGFGSTMTGMKT